MIAASATLVILAVVWLVLGLLGDQDVRFVYASIGACLAALVLVTVAQSGGRRRRRHGDAVREGVGTDDDDGWDDEEAPRVDDGWRATGGAVVASAALAPSAADDVRRTDEVLTGVGGVGPAERAVLLGHFGSFERLAVASTQDVSEVVGISDELAERIRAALDRAQA